MIAVRIPKEIKSYREKIIGGLTARQLVTGVFTLGICIPLYMKGRDFINEELLSWLIIAIAVPLGAIGFVRPNGMPFEKFIVVIIKQSLLYPVKRKYKSTNFFRSLQNKVVKEEKPNISERKFKKAKKEASLERTFLMLEAEEKGVDIDMNTLDDNLLTVSKYDIGKNNNIKKKKEKKTKVEKKSKLQIKAEKIKEKQANDPHYVVTRQEGKILLAYAREFEKKRIAEITKGKKQVQSKNKDMNKRKKTKSFIPKTAQDTIPYIADYEEGLFEVEPNKFSKCFLIQDINYLVAKEDEQVAIFCKWGEFLNYFSEEMNIALCIDNRIVSINEQEEKVFYKMTGDGYDVHRKEYNRVMGRQILAGKNDIQQNKYLTVTIECETPYEALVKFNKIEAEVINNLRKIGSNGKVMTTEERLALLHDKFRRGREGSFKVDFDFLKNQGLSSKDYVAPSSFYFKNKSWFMIEDEYYRCMYINNLPASLSDEFLYDLVDCEFPIMVSLNIQPVAQDKALRLVKKQLTGMEANKIEAEKRAVRAGYSPETISHDLKLSYNQAEELLDDMTVKDQKMFFVTIAIMVSGKTLDELEEHCKITTSKARKYSSQVQNFDFQQEEAMKVIMPMGITPEKKLFVERTLTTESTAIFVPFACQELFQPQGFYYGLNQISRNLVLCNRTDMKTPSGFILGSSGSGKSFATKREILNVLLNDDKTGVLVIDPENEYSDFARAFGGTVLNLSASSDSYINPMEMDENYGLDDNDEIDSTPLKRKKEKALQKKTEYLMSIIQCMIADSNNVSTITPQQKTIVDRSITRAYKEYLENDFDKNYLPTLLNLQEELEKEAKESAEAKLLSDGIEYYTRGSMNMFSHLSNLNFDNRFVVFNIRDLGKELKQISLLIVLDFIWNRMIENCQSNIRTYCYVDEIHVLFQNDFSARYLQQLYKRGRKYGLVITGITQDVEDLLSSDMAKGMISNSDFIMMLNQSWENLKILAKMLNISEAQMNYVSRADAGSGLLFAEKTIVPFVDRFPSDSYLYTLMSTKFGENGEINIEEIIRKQQEKNEKNIELNNQELQEVV